jgi:hypothetical protein
MDENVRKSVPNPYESAGLFSKIFGLYKSSCSGYIVRKGVLNGLFTFIKVHIATFEARPGKANLKRRSSQSGLRRRESCANKTIGRVKLS